MSSPWPSWLKSATKWKSTPLSTMNNLLPEINKRQKIMKPLRVLQLKAASERYQVSLLKQTRLPLASRWLKWQRQQWWEGIQTPFWLIWWPSHRWWRVQKRAKQCSNLQANQIWKEGVELEGWLHQKDRGCKARWKRRVNSWVIMKTNLEMKCTMWMLREL